MKKCPNCGAQNTDESLFCTECGRPIPQGNECPHCGATINEGDVFCRNCGKNISDGGVKTQSDEQTDNSTNDTSETYYEEEEGFFQRYRYYIIGLLLLVLVGGSCYWYRSSSRINTPVINDSIPVDSTAIYIDSTAVESATVDSADVDSAYTDFVDTNDSHTQEEININGHIAIDLGLSVKWASCNIGATEPEDCGDFYSWGDTKTKPHYTSNKWWKYDLDSLQEKGVIDNDRNLTPSNDVANVKWGDSWRMPTIDEIKELCRKCTWTWTNSNGVDGYIVTGSNSNSIFLPVSGYRNYYRFIGSKGFYWSATWGTQKYARCLTFDNYRRDYNSADQSIGYVVRPVSE